MLNVVTGGSGFVGSHVVRGLIARGENVRVLDLARSPDLPVEAEFIQGSITEPQTVAEALDGADAVFHLAAYAHLWAPDKTIYDKINVEGTRIVMEAALKAGASRIVHTSSLTVLIPAKPSKGELVQSGDHTYTPEQLIGRYAKSKCRAELICQDLARKGLPVTIVLPTLPVGPGDRALTPPTRMILDLLNGKTPAMLECILNLIDVRDLAEGHILARDKGRTGERYLMGCENLKMAGMLDILGKETGVVMPKAKVPYPLALLAAAIDETIADRITKRPPKALLSGVRAAGRPIEFISQRAVQDLGLEQRPVAESLRDAASWLQDQNLVTRTLPGLLKGS